MFKAIEKGKIIGINETGEFPLMNYESLEEDTEHQLSDYIHYDGEFVLKTSAEAIEQKKAEVRAVRNRYLEKYVDPKQLVLVWNSLSEDEQKEYTDYRQYLLDYPETEGWYEHSPLMFQEWKQEPELEQIVASGD